MTAITKTIFMDNKEILNTIIIKKFWTQFFGKNKKIVSNNTDIYTILQELLRVEFFEVCP